MTGRQVGLAGSRVAAVAAAGLVAVALAGCSVNVRRGDAGKDKDVSVHTPFGGLQVHKDALSAAELGLPAYPGAVAVSDGDCGDHAGKNHDGGDCGDKAVDLALGFAKWQFRVQVANYVTSDSRASVQQFYQKALARYGDVLVCQGDRTIGTPVRTGEGLRCQDEDGGSNVHVTPVGSLELKAGSERRQHIVAFNHLDGPGTHFSLVSLRLPVKGSEDGADKAE